MLIRVFIFRPHIMNNDVNNVSIIGCCNRKMEYRFSRWISADPSGKRNTWLSIHEYDLIRSSVRYFHFNFTKRCRGYLRNCDTAVNMYSIKYCQFRVRFVADHLWWYQTKYTTQNVKNVAGNTLLVWQIVVSGIAIRWEHAKRHVQLRSISIVLQLGWYLAYINH